MTTFHAVDLKGDNKYPNKDVSLKKDIKMIIGNATIYIPSGDTDSIKTIVRELNNAEPRRNR